MKKLRIVLIIDIFIVGLTLIYFYFFNYNISPLLIENINIEEQFKKNDSILYNKNLYFVLNNKLIKSDLDGKNINVIDKNVEKIERNNNNINIHKHSEVVTKDLYSFQKVNVSDDEMFVKDVFNNKMYLLTNNKIQIISLDNLDIIKEIAPNITDNIIINKQDDFYFYINNHELYIFDFIKEEFIKTPIYYNWSLEYDNDLYRSGNKYYCFFDNHIHIYDIEKNKYTEKSAVYGKFDIYSNQIYYIDDSLYNNHKIKLWSDEDVK